MMSFRNTYLYSLLIFTLLSSFQYSYSQKSDNTIVSGLVVDAKTGQPLTGTNVFFEKTTIGTITDNHGKYRIETLIPSDKIVFSFIGYETESRIVSKGVDQTINISLKLSSITLDEVKVNPGKKSYKNKNNPAVELIQKVIDNKDLNRKEKYDYL